MAIDTFIDLSSGGIKGESTDQQFPGQIEVDSWAVGAANPPDITSSKQGAGTGRPTFNFLDFSVKQTSATTSLFDRLVQGTHIPTATLSCRKGGQGQEVFFTITLSEVYVAMHEITGVNGQDNNMERFSLAYGSIQHEYFSQSQQGTMQSTGKKGYRLTTNKTM
jgi:type VI secretion system secreted protein Hcp